MPNVKLQVFILYSIVSYRHLKIYCPLVSTTPYFLSIPTINVEDKFSNVMELNKGSVILFPFTSRIPKYIFK